MAATTKCELKTARIWGGDLRCGEVLFVRFAMTDEEPKQFRGFCHVTFKGTTGVPVDKALEFDGAEVGGRELKVGCHHTSAACFMGCMYIMV